jgi:hypothetical protein
MDVLINVGPVATKIDTIYINSAKKGLIGLVLWKESMSVNRTSVAISIQAGCSVNVLLYWKDVLCMTYDFKRIKNSLLHPVQIAISRSIAYFAKTSNDFSLDGYIGQCDKGIGHSFSLWRTDAMLDGELHKCV